MSSNLPLVCVCIPVYNGAKTIAKTIESVLAQSYQNFEIIVCDNLSTDNTLQIIQDLTLSASKKITVISNPNKGSAEDNWNYLLSNLTTEAEYIALYHADDIYHKEILKNEVNLLQNNELKAVFTLCRLIDENDEDITIKKKYNPYLPKTIKSPVFRFEDFFKYILHHKNFIITPTCMFKKEIIPTIVPFFDNTKFKSSSDLDTWLRISKQYKIGVVPEILQSYRISTTQGSYLIKQGRTEPADFFKVVDSHIESLPEIESYKAELRYYRILKSNDLTICAVNFLKNEDTDNAMLFLRDAIRNSNYLVLKRFKYIKMHLFAFVIYSLLKLKFNYLCINTAKKITL